MNNATPAIGTTCVDMATNEAPNAPAPKLQDGICFNLLALKISLYPALTSALADEIRLTKINPVPNETKAATS